jgi:signal transduction histidine kinase
MEGSEVRFTVADTGPGIPPENLSHVFDRYWQAKSTAKLGTGLGLSIAKGIVEAHGGRIWAESPPNCGAEFNFTLPVA